MPRTARKAAPAPRLSDRIYETLRGEIKSGELAPGRRLLEADLAVRYKVSRTPVREALFQLAREGLVLDSERGFTLPLESPMDFAHRLEVRILLDPELARHAAQEGTDAQLAELSAVHERMKQAQQAGEFTPFVAGGHEFRMLLIRMCANPVLARCCELIENQYLAERNRQYRIAANQEFVIEYNERLIRAVLERDANEAARVARELMEILLEFVAKPALVGQPPRLPVLRAQRPKPARTPKRR